MAERPHIAILLNSLTSGGAERVVLSLLEFYRLKDIRVSLFLLETDRFYDPPDWCEVNVLSQGVEDDNGVIKVFRLFTVALRFKALLKKNNTQLVQSHMYRSNFVNILSTFFGARHRTQIVNHGLVSRERTFLSRIVFKFFIARLYPFADHCISVSAAIDSELSRMVALRSRHVINNPIDVANIEELSKESWVVGDFVPHGKRYIVLAGRLIKIKRFDLVISILPQLAEDIELVILGDGAHRPILEDLASEKGVVERCHFLGDVSNPFPYFRYSSCLVLPSESEGFPMVLLEGMVCRTPVVASDCGSGAREILDYKVDLELEQLEIGPFGLIVAQGNIPKLLEAVTYIFENPAEAKKINKAARERAARYDTENIGDEYWKLMSPFLEGM